MLIHNDLLHHTHTAAALLPDSGAMGLDGGVAVSSTCGGGQGLLKYVSVCVTNQDGLHNISTRLY